MHESGGGGRTNVQSWFELCRSEELGAVCPPRPRPASARRASSRLAGGREYLHDPPGGGARAAPHGWVVDVEVCSIERPALSTECPGVVGGLAEHAGEVDVGHIGVAVRLPA